ncbi:MAG TPA: hypothetical protein VFT66_09755 [Roseiflexaceae bacterium]|jgi:hypothetical protein|nr:hypothetical protein [Roseiflexaceae bacterium]
MAQHTRIQPWFTLSIAQGNAIQISGLVGAVVLARIAARRGRRGSAWLFASRLLAYFCEHAFAHWLVGRMGGIRFMHYGVHGTTHARLYPPGMRWVFSHLPFLSARIDPASRRAAAPAARAAMYMAGPLVTVLMSELIPLYGWRHGVPRARGLLVGMSLWMIGMLCGELLNEHGDVRRAWRAIRARD